MIIDSRNTYLTTLHALTTAVQAHHPDSETASFLAEQLRVLEESKGTAFPAKWQYLINQLPVVKASESFAWTAEERDLWAKIKEMNQLGNWGWTPNV
ncbi:MAG: hypothetical protein MR008_01120 [Aerococcus sp.]|nr:hypothetical protein [Aerococcus sp.]